MPKLICFNTGCGWGRTDDHFEIQGSGTQYKIVSPIERAPEMTWNECWRILENEAPHGDWGIIEMRNIKVFKG